jgi:serine/threonine protein kinase
MDLVDGVRITRYCDSRKPGLNRDIKPSNELVEERDGSPTPRVIDFTPAKALDSQITDDGTMLTGLGTVAGLCTSREEAKQGRQDIGTLSGICSLGAVAFELVTGTTPIERERLEKSDYVAIPRTK